MSSEYRSKEELIASARLFAPSLQGRMLELGLLDEADVVNVSVKCKTRELGGGNTKVSYHFIFDIAGFKSEQNAALSMCVQGLQYNGMDMGELQKLIKSSRQYPPVAADDPVSIFVPLDASASKSNGISMYGSKKRATDPYPQLERVQGICLGRYYVGTCFFPRGW